MNSTSRPVKEYTILYLHTVGSQGKSICHLFLTTYSVHTYHLDNTYIKKVLTDGERSSHICGDVIYMYVCMYSRYANEMV